MTMLNVLLAEDHAIVREGLRALLEEQGKYSVVGLAEDGMEAVSLAQKLHPDIVVMDISMPNLNGLEATRRIREIARTPEVIILSQHSRREYVVQAVISGAKGYLLKDSMMDELAFAIESVSRGEIYLSKLFNHEDIMDSVRRREPIISPMERLTPREKEVLQLVAEGNTNRQIASILTISTKTVEKHRFNLMEKLEIRDLAGLVRFAISEGMIIVDDST